MDFPLAPRTDSYLTNHLGFKTVSAPTWPSADSSGPVLLDPVGMPFAGAPRTVCVVGEPSTSDAYIIRRYREDPDDGPEGRYNVDTFKVWVRSLPRHLEMTQIVNAASTSYDENWRAYERGTVFVLQQPRGRDHWLAELPEHVRVILAARTT